MCKKYKKVSRSFGMVILLWTINLLAPFLYRTGFAQGPDALWTRTYGGSRYDGGWSVQQTSDGGHIIAGYTSSFGAGEVDVYLIKTDAKGDTLWTRTYGGTDDESGYSVQQTSDEGYIIAGYTYSFGAGNWDVYLIRTDANGDTLWTKTYGGTSHDEGYSVQQTSDEGYIVAGYTGSFGAGYEDVYLIKTDAKGDTLWTKTYGGERSDHGHSVQQTSDGGYIIAGHTGSFSAYHSDVYLIKTDAKGDTLWTRIYGGKDFDDGYSVQQTSDEGYIIAGETFSFGTDNWDVYLIKTDTKGDTLWTRTYGGSEYDGGSSVQQTSDGGYIIAGGTRSFGAGDYDVYLIKTDVKGDTLWTRTYGGKDYEEGYSVQQISDGGYIIAGLTHSFGAGGTDVYLIKTKPDPTGIKESFQETFFVLKCEPNPFNQKIVISYQLSVKIGVSLKVYDITGSLIKTLVRIQNLGPGTYTLEWDGRDNSGERISSGVYFLRFEACPVRPLVSYRAGEYKGTKKLLIMK